MKLTGISEAARSKRRNTSAFVIFFAALSLSASTGQAQRLDERGVLSYSSVVEPVKRSVVLIECSTGSGSGSILDKEGHILTNAHVVASDNECQITLDDFRVLDAKVIGADPFADIAILKVDAPNLTPIPMGNSDSLKVGDVVFAIGSPLGYFQTVTMGIVSGLGRVIPAFGDNFQDFIQIDATTYHGNSGGALVDSQGRLVGVTSAGESAAVFAGKGSVNVAGINFAIPIRLATFVADQLEKNGKVTRGFIGADAVDFRPALASNPDVKANLGTMALNRGAVVRLVEDGGPAAKAGLKVFDIVVSANASAISSANDLRNAIAATPINTELVLNLIRSGHQVVLKVRIETPSIGDKSAPVVFGAAFGPVAPTNALAHKLIESDVFKSIGITTLDALVVVIRVESNSPAARAGLQVDDIVFKVNGVAFGSATFSDMMMAAGEPTKLLVSRGNSAKIIPLWH